MIKADVLKKFEEYKDRPFKIGMSDEGQVLYSGIDGHWVFVDGDNVVGIRKMGINGTYGIPGMTQQESAFSVYTAPMELINYIEGYIPNKAGEVAKALEGLTPAGTSKSLEEIQKILESDSIHKAASTAGGLDVDDKAPGKTYGKFMGSYISTDKDGIPTNVEKALLDN